ncbi:hemin uptake protein HemP [Ochrobactrum daejeonense]|uniref:Hemin uptake protein HemP n=1 Tax=Brucella daejeonensis TaxID=659015 RepID=A0A7W9AY53_9HYPH|nr:hemin uptake protein HemP [Brucella daejeonensis]MBB5702723.1 hemin uptake protein HemP [Brucella daejeonensis]
MNRRIHIDMQVRLPRREVCERAENPVPNSKTDAVTAVRPQPRLDANAHEALLKTYGSRELFDGSREVGIEHGGSLYRLRITRQGKLILNK